jgi:Right handed beta helix region
MALSKRRLAPVIAVVALGVVPLLLGATSGKATSERLAATCGQILTTSVTLTADVLNCPGYGLRAGANGVVINLNGHKITASGSSNDGLFNPSFTGVVFENGTVSGFVRGVEVDGGSATITHLRVTNNSDAGIFVFFPATISNGNGGIVVGCCANDKSTVTGNFVNGNTGNGIVVSFSAASSTITSNHVLANSGDGIVASAPGATITSNIANANGGNGFSISSSGQLPSLRATSNIANANTGLGINFGASDTDGGGNRASGNGSLHQCENIVCT